MPTRPVRTSSWIPCGRASSWKASSSSGVPVSSNVTESGPRSTTRPLKASDVEISSARRSGPALTLSSSSSRSTASSGASSVTRSTLTSLWICFSICSSEWCSQSTRSVMHETPARSVGPTASESMLNPRRANIVAIRASAPGLSSSEDRDRVLHGVASTVLLVLDHVDRGGAGRDHREALLGRIDAAVDHDGAVERQRLARAPARARPRISTSMPTPP